jgi:flagellar protein FliO/FliZ
MFETLFGAEMPLPVKFFLAFAFVLGLILLAAWAVRRFGAGRLGANTRGRQPRLAVIDYASVDGRRRLILVRRDNVEHLLMIGGPTDVVVEPNIVRAVAAPRDAAAGRPTAGLEALPRAIPLPETGSNGSWPLQPEPTTGLRTSRVEPLPDELPTRPTPPLAEPPLPRPQRDTLAALADELSIRPTPPRARPAVPPPAPRPQPAVPRQETNRETNREADQETDHEIDHEVEPRLPMAQPAATAPVVTPAAPLAPAAPAANEADKSLADKSLADMAARLEAALRKPGAETRPSAPPPTPRAAQPQPTVTAPAMPRPRPTSEAKPPRPEAKPAANKTALYDSLEQEMASLLGRQTKT